MNEDIPKARRLNPQSILLVVFLIAGLTCIVLLQNKDSLVSLSGRKPLGKGDLAPHFTLPDLEGIMVNLADYKGKVVLLNIWATWCPPCVEEMPSMQKLYNELAGDDFEILAVSIDVYGAKAVLPFMKKHNLTFPALTDTEGSTKLLYNTTGVPESFLIDKNGIVAEKVIGPRNWASRGVVEYIRNLIRKN